MNEIAENQLSLEYEKIAEQMLISRGDLAKASRSPDVNYNAMQLRIVVKDNPLIRRRYHELLADELQEKGLHIAERILHMAELQEYAMGDEGEGIPPDINTVINLSKEISRLIAEGKGQNMSTKAAVLLTSKEDAKELLEAYLG